MIFPVLEKVRFQHDIRILQQFFHHFGIAADRDPLIPVIEIIVVIRKSERQTLNNKGRKIPAVASPLFFLYSL